MKIEWENPSVQDAMAMGPEAFTPEIKLEEPSTLDIAASTMRIENPASAWVESLKYRYDGEDQAGYHAYDDLPDEFIPYSEEFAEIKNPEASLLKQAGIKRQIHDREVMARGGGETIAWSLVAGIGDPINLPLMLLPGASAVRSGAGAGEVAAKVAIGGAAEAIASEGLLHAVQPTRTWQETMAAVGGTVLLAGSIGGLAGLGSKKTFKALEEANKDIDDIVKNDGLIDIDSVTETGGSAGSASVVGTLSEEGSDLLGPGINPLIRLLKSPFKTARSTMNQLQGHNFFNRKNDIETVMPDGTVRVEHRSNPTGVDTDIHALQGGLAAKYVRSIKTGVKSLKKRGSKMGEVEFRKEVGRAMRNNDKHDIPEVAKVASEIRKEVITPITKGFQDLGDLPDILTTKFARSYLPRMYDIKNIEKNMDDWLEMLTVHFTDKNTDALEARALAKNITDKIMGSPVGQLPRDIVGTTGRTKERVLNIHDDILQQKGFLVDDVDTIMQTYIRSTAGELSLKRTFGDHTLKQQFDSIEDEATILIDKAKTNKERMSLMNKRDKAIRDLSAVRDMMLGQHKIPTAENRKLTNVVRGARQATFMAQLGGMTVSAIPDIARPIMQHGVGAWARALPGGLLYFAKSTKHVRRTFEDIGIGVESALSSRAYQIADIDEVGGGLDNFARTFAKYSGMNHWNSFWKKVAGFTAQNRFLKDATGYGNLSRKRKERLAKAGIDDHIANRIAKMDKEFGADFSGGRHANTQEWTDRGAAQLFDRVLLKDVDNTVVTPSYADKPLLLTSEVGKTIGQFKTFFLAAHNQVMLPLGQQLARGDMAAVNGMVAGATLGMVAEWTKLNLAGRGDEFDNYSMQDWARAGLDRSGMVSLPMEAFNMSDRILNGRMSQAMGMSEGSRYFYRNKLGSLLGPTASYVSDGVNLASRLLNDEDLTASHIHGMRKLMPYQNLFYTRWLVNQMENSINKTLKTKPRGRSRAGGKGIFK